MDRGEEAEEDSVVVELFLSEMCSLAKLTEALSFLAFIVSGPTMRMFTSGAKLLNMIISFHQGMRRELSALAPTQQTFNRRREVGNSEAVILSR